MRLPLQSKPTRRRILRIILALLSAITVVLLALRTVYTRFDFGVLDFFYRQAVQQGFGPSLSGDIVLVLITDETYDTLNTNSLDRAFLAQANEALATYGTEAVVYDLLFSRPSTPAADQTFAASLAKPNKVYLPIAFRHADQPSDAFVWPPEVGYDRLVADYLKRPIEQGRGRPFYATQAITQLPAFARATPHSGDISSIPSDPDGVYRHAPMLLQVADDYFPALALAVFLDYIQVPFENIVVDWGQAITIPAAASRTLSQDMVIPIDAHGRTFIPYPQTWGHDFPHLLIHTFVEYSTNADYQGNLLEMFEGKFVFIGDVGTGISDLGHTPLEENVPLLIVHTTLLNSLLQNTFYWQWSFWQVLGLIVGLSALLGLSALPRNLWIMYATGALGCVALLGFTWLQLQHFTLFPVVTVGGSFVGLFLGLLISLHLTMTRDQAFIRHAFAKFVHEKVMNELLDHPEQLVLGGEERTLTVLFSDIEGFTSISERMTATALVDWLNEYLTAMTDIVVEEEGIIDKYIGDAVMAEFGAPLPLPDHADRAVRAGVRMQRRLRALNEHWQQQERWQHYGLPWVRCRIGINTGSMILGNLGSEQVLNYTVIGDAVNLAARLESANKQYQTMFMIAESTHDQLTPGQFRTRLLDVIKVKGKEQPVKVFEVYGDMAEPVASEMVAYYETYEEAFNAYLAGNFSVARTCGTKALALRPGDLAMTNLLARIETLLRTGIPADWDGSIALEVK